MRSRAHRRIAFGPASGEARRHLAAGQGELKRSALAADPQLRASPAAIALAEPALTIAVLVGSYLAGGR